MTQTDQAWGTNVPLSEYPDLARAAEFRHSESSRAVRDFSSWGHDHDFGHDVGSLCGYSGTLEKGWNWYAPDETALGRWLVGAV